MSESIMAESEFKKFENHVFDALNDSSHPNFEKVLIFALKVTMIVITLRAKDIILNLLKDSTRDVFRSLNKISVLLQPRWICGYDITDHCPEFSEIKDDLLKCINENIIDFNGYFATLIGRYGPDAHEILPEMISRLKSERTNCSLAPGLTWSVYQVGGLRPEIKELFIEIATKDDSCPHSREIATKILEMNLIAY